MGQAIHFWTSAVSIKRSCMILFLSGISPHPSPSPRIASGSILFRMCKTTNVYQHSFAIWLCGRKRERALSRVFTLPSIFLARNDLRQWLTETRKIYEQVSRETLEEDQVPRHHRIHRIIESTVKYALTFVSFDLCILVCKRTPLDVGWSAGLCLQHPGKLLHKIYEHEILEDKVPELRRCFSFYLGDAVVSEKIRSSIWSLNGFLMVNLWYYSLAVVFIRKPKRLCISRVATKSRNSRPSCLTFVTRKANRQGGGLPPCKPAILKRALTFHSITLKHNDTSSVLL